MRWLDSRNLTWNLRYGTLALAERLFSSTNPVKFQGPKSNTPWDWNSYPQKWGVINGAKVTAISAMILVPKCSKQSKTGLVRPQTPDPRIRGPTPDPRRLVGQGLWEVDPRAPTCWPISSASVLAEGPRSPKTLTDPTARACTPGGGRSTGLEIS